MMIYNLAFDPLLAMFQGGVLGAWIAFILCKVVPSRFWRWFFSGCKR